MSESPVVELVLEEAEVKDPRLGTVVYDNPVVSHYMENGKMNTQEDQVLTNMAAAIRRGHPQMRPGPPRYERICLVGSGPSLAETEEELRELLWNGAILVTLNGSYHWCRERNLRPNTQIVMDARPFNARFLTPHVPKCNYVVASQCAPELWDAVADYPDVWIFHCVVPSEKPQTDLLNAYYNKQWMGVGGGTTVATRAINLLRLSGYTKFDLFGVDCCWKEDGSAHHAISQPENDGQTKSRISVNFRDIPDSGKSFLCSPWHIKQFEDFMTVMRPDVNGRHFKLAVHGSGMLAYAVRTLGESPGEISLVEE